MCTMHCNSTAGREQSASFSAGIQVVSVMLGKTYLIIYLASRREKFVEILP